MEHCDFLFLQIEARFQNPYCVACSFCLEQPAEGIACRAHGEAGGSAAHWNQNNQDS